MNESRVFMLNKQRLLLRMRRKTVRKECENMKKQNTKNKTAERSADALLGAVVGVDFGVCGIRSICC